MRKTAVKDMEDTPMTRRVTCDCAGCDDPFGGSFSMQTLEKGGTISPHNQYSLWLSWSHVGCLCRSSRRSAPVSPLRDATAGLNWPTQKHQLHFTRSEQRLPGDSLETNSKIQVVFRHRGVFHSAKSLRGSRCVMKGSSIMLWKASGWVMD